MAFSLQKFVNLLPNIVSVLLIGVIAVQLANLTLIGLFNAEVSQANAATVPQTSSNRATSTKTNDAIQFAALISQKKLFGEAGEIQAPPQPEVIDAPETKEDLKLMGILATGNENGLAIIASGRAAEEMYRIGESLPGNSTLNAVYADRVIIENSRGLETLRIELDKNRLVDVNSTEGNLPQVATRPTRGAPAVRNTKLSALRQDIIRDPLSFAQKISIQPEKDATGNLLGYKLNPNEDQELFEELGLRSGDIATSINGLDLSESKNARRAMNILRRSRNINMTVIRDGQEVTIEQRL